MKKLFVLSLGLMLSACTTEYILMDEESNPVEDGYYTENAVSGEEFFVAEEDLANIKISGEKVETADNKVTVDDTVIAKADINNEGRNITANDVFPVAEGKDYVTYQYKNVRVDEISPLASLYCSDVAFGGSPYLREVNIYHNGFMRATFDCVSLAI